MQRGDGYGAAHLRPHRFHGSGSISSSSHSVSSGAKSFTTAFSSSSPPAGARNAHSRRRVVAVATRACVSAQGRRTS